MRWKRSIVKPECDGIEFIFGSITKHVFSEACFLSFPIIYLGEQKDVIKMLERFPLERLEQQLFDHIIIMSNTFNLRSVGDHRTFSFIKFLNHQSPKKIAAYFKFSIGTFGTITQINSYFRVYFLNLFPNQNKLSI